MQELARTLTYFPAPRTQKFCSQCGSTLTRRIPPDDTRVRDLCDNCGAIHYQNPRMVVGTLPVWQGRVLLCKRAIEPRLGYWTLPAGFMELGETSAAGAQRETLEEAGLQSELGALFSVIDVPQADQVHVFFLIEVTDPSLAPGQETLEAHWVEEADVPWDDLAFRTVSLTLERFFADRRAGQYGVHYLALPPRRG
ncbi:NUDIX hydrolase [Achromobacter sp. GG226]|uniref:NUDIX hydrolase n=1 Tax=Verticiella alkaliphila TaxID=2779529 RepID=UPI001C0AF6F6|nr:NUDIX hydrolase [Verticiella sp. GG226]MBU4610538.1 NUDIX hydrolase [Verticiella sp. GG226]